MMKKEQISSAPSPAFPEQSAGNFATWLQGIVRAKTVKVTDSNVPCGECIACCRASLFIHIRPGETEALRRIPKPLLFAAPGAPKGHQLLGFNQRGECPMLRAGCCSIYEHRPQTCCDFDCRVLAATGIVPEEEGPQGELARRARSWRFDLASEKDREQYDAVQAAGAFLREHRAAFPPDALPRTPVQLAVLAIEIYGIFAARGLASRAKPATAEIARQVLACMEQRGDQRAPKPGRRARTE